MAGVESCFRILGSQPLSQSRQFFFRLLAVEQVETSDDGTNWPRTSRQNVLKTAMGTACKQQTVDIQSQLMTEIVVDVIWSIKTSLSSSIFGHSAVIL